MALRTMLCLKMRNRRGRGRTECHSLLHIISGPAIHQVIVYIGDRSTESWAFEKKSILKKIYFRQTLCQNKSVINPAP
jgi:hypothetical protein